MKYTVTLKGFIAPEIFKEHLKKYIQKLSRRLVHFKNDLPIMSFVVKKHEKHMFFSGQLTLYLPQEALIARCSGHSEEEVLSIGFDRLIAEFEKYKGKRFSSNSTYRDRSTIRRDTNNV